MQQEDMTGKVIVVTGASSGFGKGIARQLCQRGASVVVAARRGELLDELAGEGGKILPVETDVGSRTEVERLVQTTLRSFGRIDVWINNAGVGAIGPMEQIPLEDHERVVQTTLLGTLYGSWFAYRQFVAQKSGTLINIASELGHHTVPYYASYAAAKHGVIGLDDSLRQEIVAQKYDDIHVCTVMPTAHDTPFFDHAANYSGHEIQAAKPLHDPKGVIEAVVQLIENPKDKKIVGGDGILKIVMKNIAPAVAEAMATKQVHAMQMEQAPPAADSDGAVHEPMPTGTDVHGGRR